MADRDAQYRGISKEHFNTVMARYEEFVKRLDKVDLEPINVFNPLSKKAVEDIYLIREASAGFQKKKEEDLKKIAQAAQDEANEIEKAASKKEAEEKANADQTPKEN